MFCFSGLTADQVDLLVSEFHIYLTRNGRMRYIYFWKIKIFVVCTNSFYFNFFYKKCHKLFLPVLTHHHWQHGGCNYKQCELLGKCNTWSYKIYLRSLKCLLTGVFNITFVPFILRCLKSYPLHMSLLWLFRNIRGKPMNTYIRCYQLLLKLWFRFTNDEIASSLFHLHCCRQGFYWDHIT